MAYQPNPTDIVTTGTITALDAVVAAPSGGGVLLTGASTAGSVAATATLDSMSSWMIMVTGTWTGTLYFETSMDSTNGTDGNWIVAQGRQSGTSVGDTNVMNNTTGNGIWRGNCAGFDWLRVRSKGASHTGTANIRFHLSTGTGPIFMNASIPGGYDTIGGICQTYNSATARSGTITTGGTAQTIAPASLTRVAMTVQNTSAVNMMITEDGTTASSTNGYLLWPGATAKINTRNAISLWCGTTGSTFAGTELF